GMADLASDVHGAVADALRGVAHAATEFDDAGFHVVARLLGVALDAVLFFTRGRAGEQRRRAGTRKNHRVETRFAHGSLRGREGKSIYAARCNAPPASFARPEFCLGLDAFFSLLLADAAVLLPAALDRPLRGVVPRRQPVAERVAVPWRLRAQL